MKKSIFSPILFVATAMFLTGCNKEEVIEFDQDINVTIQGVTYDADGNSLLSDVTVTLLGDESVTTEEDGVYQFKGKESGTHLLRFEKEGYATMVQTLGADGHDFTAEELTESSVIEMYHTNEAATTTFKISNGEEIRTVADVPVTIELNSTGDAYFENDKIETTTDADGVLSLAGLPDVVLTITAEIVDGTDVYSRTIFSTADGLASSYTLNKTSLLEDFELVDSNIIVDDTAATVDDFAATDNITFTFSDEINADYDDMEVTLTKVVENREIVVTTTVSGTTLTIDPLGDALEEGEMYSVYVKAQSLDADAGTYEETFTFTVAGEELVLGQVVSVSLDEIHDEDLNTDIQETDTNFRIQFDSVDDAADYEVYGLYTGGANEYVRLLESNVSTADDNRVEYFVNLVGSGLVVPDGANGYFDNNETLTIIVRAVSGDVYGEFSEPFTIEEGSDTND